MMQLATELEKMDYIGLAALVTALTGMVTALGVILVKLKEISAQNIILKDGQENIQTKQEVIRKDVNSNMSDANNRIERLHNTIAQQTSDARDLAEIERAKPIDVKPIDVNLKMLPADQPEQERGPLT